MITSRGCPYQCSYCDRSVFKRSYRYNSAEYIYEHMKHLRSRFGVRHINIYDDLFTPTGPASNDLCELLTAGRWACNSTARSGSAIRTTIC